MSRTSCDPRLFRLRAFERDWLAPLHESGGPLAPLLAAEGEQWIALGRRLGHFADAPADRPAPPAEAEAFGARLSAQLAGDAFEDPAVFAARLAEAQEDLTPARRAFLEVVLFSDDEAWRRRLQEGVYLVEALRGPLPLFPDEERLERTGWILEGAVSAIDERSGRSPAHWRSQAPGALAEVWPQAEERLSMLAELHAMVMDAGATLAAREHWQAVAAREQAWQLAMSSWPYARDRVLPGEPLSVVAVGEGALPRAGTEEPAAEERERHGSFAIEPLQRGFGDAFGDALRRVLLGTLEGAAVTSVRIAGDAAAFEESLADVGERLAGLVCRMSPELQHVEARLVASGPASVTARDIVLPPGVEILNGDAHVATVREGATLEATLTIERGRGRRPASAGEETGEASGAMPVDATFTPILWATYAVEPVRAGERSAYDKLTLEVETDGSVDPSTAVREAASRLASQLDALVDAMEALAPDPGHAAGWYRRRL